MDHVNKTLYIPLYGKALVSGLGIILDDPKAEEIWGSAGISLKGKSASKWLAYYMGMRSAVFDRWLTAQMTRYPHAVVLHLGCGLDSRNLRVGTRGHRWYDVDFPAVMQERKRFYDASGDYSMVCGDIREDRWLSEVSSRGHAIVVMEGVSMYLDSGELRKLMTQLLAHFSGVSLLMDCYTCFAAKASKYKNPINDVGVTKVWGVDDPEHLAEGTGMKFTTGHDMTPQDLIGQLFPREQRIFRLLYGGRMADRLYRLYEFEG